ncbi:branched-chain amino acid transport system II carrier protein [Robertkochia flava]|uniref:branched-chain amino acid transport system II carrier protein n=1 Tax=Robertkochia flava TaxID=3447986 RepID=UPI001CCB15CB|nr:branched-chain amino acid transport system II carrier protein [Robertkochia marina]
MRNTKLTLLTSFALFSLFFGAGNIILPPYLGFTSGNNWPLVTLGFIITAVIIPILGIRAHAKLQGSMLDFANKVSPVFSIVFCSVVYLIAVCLPSPRTASLTHEMAVAPYLDVDSLVTSSLYFSAVFLFVIFRSQILDLIGRFLTPFILIILCLVIAMVAAHPEVFPAIFSAPPGISEGILEGYQTYDAMGAVVVGAVIIISLNFKPGLDYLDRKRIISRAGILAGLGLCLIYAGLIYSGALLSGTFDPTLDRSGILNAMILFALGTKGHIFLAVLIALACFSTTVGIVTGASDYVRGLFKDRVAAYRITAASSCLAGVLIGQLEVGIIIDIGIPALLFIYPLIITFILLHNLPSRWTDHLTFRAVTFTVLLFSVPDVLGAIGFPWASELMSSLTPWDSTDFTWVVPALVVFLLMQIKKNRPESHLPNRFS